MCVGLQPDSRPTGRLVILSRLGCPFACEKHLAYLALPSITSGMAGLFCVRSLKSASRPTLD